MSNVCVRHMGKTSTSAGNVVDHLFVSTGDRNGNVRSARVLTSVNTANRERNARSARVLAFASTTKRDRHARRSRNHKPEQLEVFA